MLQLNAQQKRLYLFEQKRIKGGSFSIPISFEFDEKLSTIHLVKALENVIQQHENFHFIFQTIDNDIFIETKYHDIIIRTIKVKTEKDYKEIIQSDIEKDFNLNEGPLYRFIIFELSEKTVLYFNIHHLIWDGTSSSIFINDLNKAYQSILKNKKLTKNNLKENRYQNYIERDKRFLDEHHVQLIKQAKEFYQEFNKLQLPIDYARPKEFIHQAKMTYFELDQKYKSQVESYLEKHNINMYNFFLSCYAILIKRYTSQDQFYIGAPLLGRHSREDIKSLGFYVQTALIPFETKEDMELSQIYEDTLRNFSQAQKLARLPFEERTQIIDSDYDLSRTAGYQTFFMYQDFSNKKLEIDGIKYRRNHLSSGISQSELDLWLAIYNDRICGGFHFPIHLFKEKTVQTIQDDFLYIIDEIIHKNPQKIDDLHISARHENEIKENFYVFRSNETESVLRLFEEQVNKNPSKCAIKSKNGELTYLELDQYSNLLAQNIIEKGIAKESLIAVSVERDCPLMIALLGILKADCTYLPVDYKFPKDRIEYMLEHSGAATLIIDHVTEDHIDHKNKINLTSFINKLNAKNSKRINYESKPSQSAYIIYTSGSTGKPKGVELTIESMSNFLLSMQEKPGLKSDDTLCAVTTLSFDISVLELYLPLISGATVYIADSEEAKNSQVLAKIINDHNISIMQATPITWRLLFNSGWDGKNNLKVLCGGEKMPLDLAKELIRSCHSLWNMYGPTETTVWSTCKQLLDNNELITIGYPIRNTSIRILNQKFKNVPLGAIGEIYIGGHGLAKGYYKREDLTQERFLMIDGERFYRTGDQGRLTSWNEVICLGRLDHQVKIRGHRIELGEIEFQISQIPEINQSIVIIREDIPGDKKLVSYLTLKNEITETKIKEHILSKLPPYMLPEYFVFLDEMPLTPNGKIDQKNLPAPYAERLEIDDNLSLPKTKTEKTIAEIWKAQLAIPNVYLEDNFFDIGGNSLAAAGVFHKMSIHFKCNLELALLFEFPNLTLLAKEIDAIQSGKKRNFSNIVTLKNNQSDKNMFFFHAIGGNTLNYRLFVDKADDFNCYGVQSDGVDGHNVRISSLEIMAENYVRQIIEIQPEGPYYLVGGSLGGLLAYEVARLLRNRRKEVKPIIMFDTAVPQRKRSKIDQINRKEKKSFRTFGFDQMRRRILGLINIFYRLFRIPLPIIFRVPLLEFYNFLALKRYRPKDFEGDLYMIRIPIKEKGIYSRKDLGWGDYIHGKIDVDYVDAPHDEFIESSVVADVFEKFLKSDI